MLEFFSELCYYKNIMDQKFSTQQFINPREYISVNPAVCHGKPCFKGTRIMVHLVLELLEADIPVEDIIGDKYYPELTRKHIQATLHYAGDLLKTREYAA
jgi:uncharacterized protein (DUF433 family)